MSSIDRLEDYEEYYIQGMQNEQRVQKSPIETLPPEVLTKVFSYLGKDLPQVTSVNKQWREVAIVTAKHEKFSAMKSFVNFVCDNLEASHADQKKQLLDIIKDTKILDSVNLYQVKSSIDGVNTVIIDVLKNLDAATLDKLEALSKNETIPLFFEDVLFLARINKQVDEANASGSISEALSKIVDALLEKGKNEEATKIAHTIPYGELKDETLSKIADVLFELVDALLEQGKIKKATKIAYSIPVDVQRSKACLKIVDALLEKSKPEKAAWIAYRIPFFNQKFEAILKIVDALLEQDKIEEATSIAYAIPWYCLDPKISALKKVVKALLENGNAEEATKIANTIEEATEIANTIPRYA